MSEQRAMSNFNGNRQPSLRRHRACEDLAALRRQHAGFPPVAGTATQEAYIAVTQPDAPQSMVVTTGQTTNGVVVGGVVQVSNQNPYTAYGAYGPLALTNNHTEFPPNQQLGYQNYQPNQQLNSQFYQPTQQPINYQQNQQSSYQLQPNQQLGHQFYYQSQQFDYQQGQQLNSFGGQVTSLPAGTDPSVGTNTGSTGQNNNSPSVDNQQNPAHYYWFGSQDN